MYECFIPQNCDSVIAVAVNTSAYMEVYNIKYKPFFFFVIGIQSL
jgi:hypothetical protein